MVSATPQQTWGRAPLLRLLPAEGGARAHYRIAYGDDQKDFVLSKRDGTWALRLRRHLKSQVSEWWSSNIVVPTLGTCKFGRY